MEQYLERIGYTGDRTPNLENLSRLVRCHLETVPFENLDCLHNPTVFSLNLEDLLDKVVTRRRGGVCCELNTLFNALLTYLGYNAYSIMVRITMRPGPRPITHQCVITVIDGKRYYCDVGFGGPGSALLTSPAAYIPRPSMLTPLPVSITPLSTASMAASIRVAASTFLLPAV